MSDSNKLGQQAVNSTFWVFLERLSLESFRFVTTIVLARILGPKDFGVVALTAIFITISTAIIDSGFSKALLRKKESSRNDESTVFFFNLFVCGLLVLILNLISGFVSEYYAEPRLKLILQVLSLTLVISSFRQIQQVVLSKQFQFKLQFKANVFGSLTSGVVGITLAYLGFGVWALVIQAILDNLIKTLLFWYFSSWRPLWIFSKVSFKELYGYGFNIFFGDLLATLTDNMYGFVIARTYSPYQLGLYDRGNKLVNIIIINFQVSLQKVTLPLFAKVQDDRMALKAILKKSLDLIIFLVVPSIALLGIVAKPLVIVLLSEKWIGLVPYVQLFCIYWIFFPFSGVNSHLVVVLGKSKVVFKQSIFIYGVQLVALLITYRLGVTWIIIGQIVGTIIRQLILIYYSQKYIQFGYVDQLGVFFRYVLFAGIGILPFYFLCLIIQNSFLLIAAQVISGAICYLVIAYFFKSQSLYFIISQYKKKFKPKVENENAI